MRRCVNKILGVLASTFMLFTSVHAADKIRVTFTGPAAQFIPLQLAQKKGILKDEGLEAEMVQMRGSTSIAALVNGDTDYHTIIGSGVGAAMRGLQVRVVACFVPAPPIVLIARPQFKSVKDLKGQTIGANPVGASATSASVRIILRHFGLDPEKDVKFLTTGDPPARLAMMQQGLTAATLASAPIDYLGTKMGFVILARAYELFSYPDSGLVTSARKIKEKPDEVNRVIKAGIKANRYIRANREGTIQFLMERQKIDREMAAATYDGVATAFNEDGSVPEKGLRLVIEETKKAAKVNRDVPLSEVVDLSILREAQWELGIKGK
jgi:ABC-type nitrate/sulfonate/bicarbonate transport system substrate-binding protein